MHVNDPHVFDIDAQAPGLNYVSGNARFARDQFWPVLTDISMYSPSVAEDGMREPHWHPVTAEMGYQPLGVLPDAACRPVLQLQQATGRSPRILQALSHYDGIVVFSQTDFTEDLTKITIPVLVMHSVDDQIVPHVAAGPKSSELLQNGTLKTYGDNFPHGMPTTHADVINADLLAFLTSQRRRSHAKPYQTTGRPDPAVSVCRVIVLLPPSETKRIGGDGPPLQLEALAFPALQPLRTALVDELVELASDRPASRRALAISASQDAEIDRNAALRAAPTLPAISRYTGVLYEALDIGSLRGATRARAQVRLAVGSALFGLLRADDAVPAYRLSATSKLPGRPTLAARWKPLLEPVLAEIAAVELVVDLRSGSYAGLGRLPEAVRVEVLAERADGRRSVVSHFNKAHKGRLARILATTRSEPDDAAGVAATARRAGMRVERRINDITVVIPA